MAYEIELERDTDRGLDRYRIAVAEGLGDGDAGELADWLAAAAQNPTAAFTLELPAAGADELDALIARSGPLGERVDVVRRVAPAPLP